MRLSSSGLADDIKSGSIDCKDLLGQLHRYGRPQSKMTVVDDSESLSDIDDDELSRYINSKDEIRCKKVLWEEINREQPKNRCIKRAAEGKRAGPVKKASKVTIEADNRNDRAGNETRRSSKINYDALEKLDAEWNI